MKDFIQKGIAKQTNVENKNSIGLKAVSFLVQNDEIYKSVGKLLTKALFNAILLIVYNYVLRNFLPHNFDYVICLAPHNFDYVAGIFFSANFRQIKTNA